MSPAATEKATTTPPPPESDNDLNRRRFGNLRGVQWRIDLGILPNPHASSSVDGLRRVAADSRRRYAGLRRHLLVDPHVPRDGISTPPDLIMDNPLSQNPDSTWGRFFRNAELEKTVDQDLSRLYPEHGSYFQTPGCQGMLRRILFLWCLRHPECGYRQGMHELLAPLLYVLHVDVKRLSEVRKQFEDHFTDKFDGLSFYENDLRYEFNFKKKLDSMEDQIGSHGKVVKVGSLDELEPEIQTIVLLSDAYGAEGELGVVLSEKFVEHDAYCMFDALMSGSHGSIAVADFFNSSPAGGSHSGLPPVIEASAALYHLLSVVDSSLHSHLVELGVEPQYFSLRWLRVLFGREFSLEDILSIWDEIFAADKIKLDKGSQDDTASSFGTFNSPQGALISAMAVSMILHLRSSLLATENATTCLQRLLNFPKDIDLRKLIDKSKSLQDLALDANKLATSPSFLGVNNSKRTVVRGHHNLSFDSVSPKAALNMVPESYWEEKWRVLHKAEELKHSSSGKQTKTPRKGWSGKLRLSLSRAESAPSPSKVGSTDNKSSVRRNLLEDLSRELGLDEDIEKAGCHGNSGQKDHISAVDVETPDGVKNDFTYRAERRLLSESSGSEENSSLFSDTSCPLSDGNELENDSEKSSIASNISVDENDDHAVSVEEDSALLISDHPDIIQRDSTSTVSHPLVDSSPSSGSNNEPTGNTPTNLKERKLQLGKFQWFWKFGRNAGGDERSQKGIGVHEVPIPANDASYQMNTTVYPSADGSDKSCASGKEETDADQNVMGGLRNLGQSMLEHIQVIESVFQQERGQVGSLENFSKNVIVGKGQATAMTALKELRNISNLLSQM